MGGGCYRAPRLMVMVMVMVMVNGPCPHDGFGFGGDCDCAGVDRRSACAEFEG